MAYDKNKPLPWVECPACSAKAWTVWQRLLNGTWTELVDGDPSFFATAPWFHYLPRSVDETVWRTRGVDSQDGVRLDICSVCETVVT